MKLGDSIGGYLIVSEPTNQGGGKCVWAFAERDGRSYFVKQFLDPKRPREGAPDSPRTRALLEECADFEFRQRLIGDRVNPRASGSGNLVLPVAFFYERSTYYKVTERIIPAPLANVFALDTRNKCVLLRTLTLSVLLLHEIGMVHGDLKPENVVIQQRAANAFHVAKLIDLEDSYLSGAPPECDVITGGPPYCSPELLRYMREDGEVHPSDITTSTDVFSLALMTHRYLTGALPQAPSGFESPADVVNARLPLGIDERLTPSLRALIEAATERDPLSRPATADFFTALKDPDACVLRRLKS
ncbi:protein kinase domain-containing protein [Actinomadura scrupuli]|uniref:protein kinase domain-containing protein n=1 Tax=Actinomadura scrupuli TaxID=559629 RepID=UPI003D99111C